MKVSQSLLKSILALSNTVKGDDNIECGLVYKKKFVDFDWSVFPPSETQNLGAWFEYMATGAIPKNGEIPQPRYLRKLDDDGKAVLATDYALNAKHVENFKGLLEYYKIEILEVGKDISWVDENGDEWTGTLDILAKAGEDIYAPYGNAMMQVVAKGQTFVIDLKNTGLLDDKWHSFGWDLSKLDDKVKLVTQPIHYKYILKETLGEEPPFLFFLFSSANANDYRIIDFRVSEEDFDYHKNVFVRMAVNRHKKYVENGFPAIPSMLKCSECWLNNDYRAKKTEEVKADSYYIATLKDGYKIFLRNNKKLEMFTENYNGMDLAVDDSDPNNLILKSYSISGKEVRFITDYEPLDIKRVTQEKKDNGWIEVGLPESRMVFNYDKKMKKHIAKLGETDLALIREDAGNGNFKNRIQEYLIDKKEISFYDITDKNFIVKSTKREPKVEGIITVTLNSGEEIKFTYAKKHETYVATYNNLEWTLTLDNSLISNSEIKPYKIVENELQFKDVTESLGVVSVENKTLKYLPLEHDCEFKAKIPPITIYFYGQNK